MYHNNHHQRFVQGGLTGLVMMLPFLIARFHQLREMFLRVPVAIRLFFLLCCSIHVIALADPTSMDHQKVCFRAATIYASPFTES